MSQQLGRVVSEVLQRYFGEIVQQVGDDLFASGCKPIALIVKSTGLTRAQVVDSLRSLLKFDLASFEPSANEVIADYRLLPDNVLLLIRYPRYLLQIKSKFGSEAELLVEELLQCACCTATHLLTTVPNKYKDDKEKNVTLLSLKDTFISLATAGYIQQAPVAELKEGSEVPALVPVATIVPEFDLRSLQAIASGNQTGINDNVCWKVNYDRFHQDFRDEFMIKAICRRIDDTGFLRTIEKRLMAIEPTTLSLTAGEVMRLLLQQMYLSSAAWAAESNPAPALDIREHVRAVDNPLLHQYLDMYLKVIEENGAGFVKRVGDAAGGQYVVRAKHAAEMLAVCALEHVITERLGSKAARIFRLIRSKKYIEEEDIQKHAMLPNKECKELTYKLLEEHFINVQTMRKAASSGVMAKAIYLYHVNLREVVHTAQEMAYRSLTNLSRRSAHERGRHARLLDKQRRVRTLVHSMRERHEPEQNIADVEETLTPPERALLQAVEKRLKQLSAAELQLDRTLFVLHWYLIYPH